MTSIAVLSTLQQVQANLTAMFPGGAASAGASDRSTLDSFERVLAMLSSAPAGGVMGFSSTSATSATSAVTGVVTGAQVVADSKKYLGVRYVLGGESTSGIDCSALVQKSYGDLGITLPRLVHQQKLMGTAVPSLAQAQPGDLIVFRGGDHIAIYEGNGRVMHAPYPGRVVSDQKLWVGDSGIETIRRIVPSVGSTDAASATTSAATASAGTSAAVQAAALATVRAVIQADFGLVSSAANSTPAVGLSGTSGPPGTSAASALQSAISAMTAGAATDPTSSTVASTGWASSRAAEQMRATVQAMLVQGRG